LAWQSARFDRLEIAGKPAAKIREGGDLFGVTNTHLLVLASNYVVNRWIDFNARRTANATSCVALYITR